MQGRGKVREILWVNNEFNAYHGALIAVARDEVKDVIVHAVQQSRVAGWGSVTRAGAIVVRHCAAPTRMLPSAAPY